MRAIFSALYALVISGNAHADPACNRYRELMPDAPAGYVQLRGEQIHPRMWISNSKVADAESCIVAVNEAETMYACRWSYFEEAQAKDAYDRSLAEAKVCFPDWAELPRVNWDNDPFPQAPGTRFVGPNGYTYYVAIIPQDTPLGRAHFLATGLYWRPSASVS